MVFPFSITLTKEVDFNQASPSYEVAMEISKGKKKEKKPWCFYFAAKYLSNGKNGLTNPPLKYPASRKVLFGTERLSGRTWARLLLGNGKLIRFWDDVWPCHSPQRCMP